MAMSDDTRGMSKEEKIVHEAKRRMKAASEFESTARKNAEFDTRFANGDAQNMAQWPDSIKNDRGSDNRPCLTVNKTMQHCLQIINDQRQNPSQISIRPIGNGATYDSAMIMEGVCRHIELQSQAQQAYNNACYGQVISGLGFWRIVTEYADADSFDQEIFIRRVADPNSIYFDIDCQEADKSDMRWAIVYRDYPRDEFEMLYPDYAEEINTLAPLGIGSDYDHDAWNTKDHVRVAEYFRKTMKPDRLHLLDNGMTVRESDVKQADLLDQLKINSVRDREIESPDIEWFLIAGSKIIDKKSYPGSIIPIVPVIGIETVIDKVLDRRGHTRALIDPQRIYNYWTSSAVEFVALQSKTPYIAAVEAVNGFQDYWDRLNIDNKPYLPYNSIDESGNPIPRPERAPPPIMSTAYMDGLKISAGEMMMVSGQYEANMGQKSNEVSGKAVDARQRQGDTSTYHFIDRFANAIRLTGRILIDLIPKVYDTERVMRILAINGDQMTVKIDPSQQVGHVPVQDKDADDFSPDEVMAIFNPAVGRFGVEADIQPAYATRRQEAFHAISDIIQNQETLLPVVGDLLFRAADFPYANEIAQRMKNMVPPQALGQPAASPQLQQAQAQLAQQHQVMMQQESELQIAKLKLVAMEKDMTIKEYEAETNRMKAVGAIVAAHAKENAAMAQPPEENNGSES